MKLYTYWKDGAEHIGVGCDEDSLYPVEAFGLSFADMTDLIRRITMEEKKRLADLKNAVGAPLPLKGLKLCAPIPHPAQDVICLGINYHAHAAESARFNAKAFGGERPKAIYFPSVPRTRPGTATRSLRMRVWWTDSIMRRSWL